MEELLPLLDTLSQADLAAPTSLAPLTATLAILLASEHRDLPPGEDVSRPAAQLLAIATAALHVSVPAEHTAAALPSLAADS